MRKSWQPYARHILDAIAKIDRITKAGNIEDDEILYDATLRNLQTLCEASQRLPTDIKARYSDIPWTEISGFRNILVHNYLGDIDPLTVSAVVRSHLPALAKTVQEMLRTQEDSAASDAADGHTGDSE